MSNAQMTVEQHIADLRARGMNRAADKLSSAVKPISVEEFVGETVVVEKRASGSASFKAGEYSVFVESVRLGRNVKAGSARLDFKLFVVDSPRPVFTSITLKGKNLDLVNKLGFRFGGQLLTDWFGAEEIQVVDIYEALSQYLTGNTIKAWIREDEPNGNGDVYLTSSATTWKVIDR